MGELFAGWWWSGSLRKEVTCVVAGFVGTSEEVTWQGRIHGFVVICYVHALMRLIKFEEVLKASIFSHRIHGSKVLIPTNS